MALVALSLIFVFIVATNVANGLPMGEDKIVSIVGGDEVDITEYPYQALMLFGGRLSCGGSIISEQYILTAAHCVRDVNVEWVTVKIGSSQINNGGQTYVVSKIFVHPRYNPRILDYDVAVLKTANKMSIDNNTTKIVKLAKSGSSMKPGQNVLVSGWGRIQESGPTSNVLKAVAVPVISLKHCKRAYEKVGAEITKRMLCAGYDTDGKDACSGDSGGPAVDEESRVQYGIVSWGKGCARKDFPGVYTNIAVVRDWITKVTGI